MAAEDAAARSRLSAVMEDRRLELSLKWDKVAEQAGLSIAHLRRVRAGDVPLTGKTMRKLEKALRWKSGSVAAILDGNAPEPAADDVWAEADEPLGSSEIPAEVVLGELEPWEAHLWQTPQLSVNHRRTVIDLVRKLRSAGQPLA